MCCPLLADNLDVRQKAHDIFIDRNYDVFVIYILFILRVKKCGKKFAALGPMCNRGSSLHWLCTVPATIQPLIQSLIRPLRDELECINEL